MLTCTHGLPLGACDACDREIRAAQEHPIEALEPLRAWVAEHRAELVRLSDLTRDWAHLHTELVLSEMPAPNVAKELEEWAKGLCDGLFDLAAVLATQPDDNALIENATGCFAIALCHVVEAPELGIGVSRFPGALSRLYAKAEPSKLATSLLKSARAVFSSCVSAFMAEEGTIAAGIET